ncbi:carbonic anhydrase [Acrocarpospora catenulata]|uniref:carbonic anhydrase n=1 Tax=Acrocarpospora catenulata TaxID=2836182 RepID=UPI001BD9DD87|nr:carbonic anhydrase [Acrocarpospora catenulata]
MRDDTGLTRRRILSAVAMLTGGFLAGAALVGEAAVEAGHRPDLLPTTPDEAWRLLMAGNDRWASGRSRHPHQDLARRVEVSAGQSPYAVVVSCIDSRVPPEMIFDTGIGDVLAVRTAAHTVDPLVTAAIEYGPADLRASLVVVLGHQYCGAVTAAAEALASHRPLPHGLRPIETALRPAYQRSSTGGLTGPLLIESMIHDHTTTVADALCHDPLLAPRARSGGLQVVGAYYSLESGRVTRLV